MYVALYLLLLEGARGGGGLPFCQYTLYSFVFPSLFVCVLFISLFVLIISDSIHSLRLAQGSYRSPVDRVNREFKKLRRQLQRKRHIKI